MQDRTRINVEAALAGEAMAVLRYQLFADQAQEEGYDRIADLFGVAADDERKEHFRALASLMGLVGSTRANLRAAIAGEVIEHRGLYRRFAAEAREDGEREVARRFEELARGDHCHADRLREALDELEVADLEVVGA